MIEIKCAKCGTERSLEDRMRHLGSLCPSCREQAEAGCEGVGAPGSLVTLLVRVAVIVVGIVLVITALRTLSPHFGRVVASAVIVALAAIFAFTWYLQYRARFGTDPRSASLLDQLEELRFWSGGLLALTIGVGLIILWLAMDHRFICALLVGAWIGLTGTLMTYRAKQLNSKSAGRTLKILAGLGTAIKMGTLLIIAGLSILIIWAFWR